MSPHAYDVTLADFEEKVLAASRTENVELRQSALELGGLTAENPLETKLSLAEEFRAIGDLEGARSLAEEVLSEASGALKAKATAFLNDLS